MSVAVLKLQSEVDALTKKVEAEKNNKVFVGQLKGKVEKFSTMQELDSNGYSLVGSFPAGNLQELQDSLNIKKHELYELEKKESIEEIHSIIDGVFIDSTKAAEIIYGHLDISSREDLLDIISQIKGELA